MAYVSVFKRFSNTLMKMHNCGKFHDFHFVVVKLKVFKFFLTDSASMKWSFLGGFWALTLPNKVQHCRNSHQR